jgi:uracil-DNA glycosylase
MLLIQELPVPIRRGLPFDLPSASLIDWDPASWPIDDDWRPLVSHFLASATAHQLGQFIRQRQAANAVVYPPHPFHALALTPLSTVKVLILGQDPYHGPGQAQGLAFSVMPGVRVPPSLRNIFKEIGNEALGSGAALSPPQDGSLLRWAQQGVLLLNTCLTVEQGQPASHAKQGWEVLTDEVIKAVASKSEPLVFLLWGAHAQAKQAAIHAIAGQESAGGGMARHLVLTANHPSPLSALRAPKPFLGCGHFTQANAFLERHGCTPIVW